MQTRFLFIVLGFTFLVGCSSAPRLKTGHNHKELLAAACSPGKTTRTVEGHLWLKANSKEVSGQFPADVTATAPDHLKLEITNILGGTEALILVNGEHYEIRRGSSQEAKKSEGYGSWGGIPLLWATELFLGRIPCPDPERKWKLSTNENGDLVVETGGPEAIEPERYTYSFRDLNGKPWADSLIWERLGRSSDSVEFKFDDPDNDTMSPKKWEAKSRDGKIRVRWKNREVTSSGSK